MAEAKLGSTDVTSSWETVPAGDSSADGRGGGWIKPDDKGKCQIA